MVSVLFFYDQFLLGIDDPPQLMSYTNLYTTCHEIIKICKFIKLYQIN